MLMKKLGKKENFNFLLALILNKKIIIVFFIVIVFGAYAKAKPEVLAQQIEIIGEENKLLDEEFWINQQKFPNKEILDYPTIAQLNQKIIKRGYLLNPLNLGERISSRLVLNYLDEDLALIRRYIKYDLAGNRYRDPSFKNYLTELIDLKGVLTRRVVQVQYGLTVGNANLRFFPTDKIYVRKKTDTHFDIMQKSFLSLNNAVAIIHTSKDGNWYFVESKYTRGWLKKEKVALVTMTDLKNYLAEKKSVITVEVENPVYQNKNVSNLIVKKIPMGVSFRLADDFSLEYFATLASDDWVNILLPYKSISENLAFKKVYIQKKYLHESYLPLTTKNLIHQSFKFLNIPYAWGGDENGVDCSLFLVRVFNTFGIELPRSSNLQKKIFNQELKVVNQNHYPQIAFLAKPNHIMLFLGSYQKRDYYIHSLWSFRNERDEEIEIKSVIVSDSELGAGSYLGSLKERINYQGALLN